MTNIPLEIVNIFDGTTVNVLIAFAAGTLTFFASCLLPMVPLYLIYITGISYATDKNLDMLRKINRAQVLLNSLVFVLTFTFMFVIVGVATNSFYQKLLAFEPWLKLFVGVTFVILGTFNVKPNAISIIPTINIKTLSTKWELLNSAILGLAMGLAWIPCIGPVLGVILYWTSQSETLVNGVILLTAFGLGMTLPFVLVGIGAEHIVEKLKPLRVVQKFVGIVIVVVGLYAILESLQMLI